MARAPWRSPTVSWGPAERQRKSCRRPSSRFGDRPRFDAAAVVATAWVSTIARSRALDRLRSERLGRRARRAARARTARPAGDRSRSPTRASSAPRRRPRCRSSPRAAPHARARVLRGPVADSDRGAPRRSPRDRQDARPARPLQLAAVLGPHATGDLVNCAEFKENVAAYVLGTLEPEERRACEAHLAETIAHEGCREAPAADYETAAPARRAPAAGRAERARLGGHRARDRSRPRACRSARRPRRARRGAGAALRGAARRRVDARRRGRRRGVLPRNGAPHRGAQPRAREQELVLAAATERDKQTACASSHGQVSLRREGSCARAPRVSRHPARPARGRGRGPLPCERAPQPRAKRATVLATSLEPARARTTSSG